MQQIHRDAVNRLKKMPVTVHTVGWHYFDALKLKNLIIVMTMRISEKCC